MFISEKKSFFGNAIKAILVIVTGVPVYIYGLINNILPFEIPGWIAGRISKQKEFRGAIGMVGGVFTFLIFYSVQLLAIWKCFHLQWLTIIYGISLPLSGLFTYWYYHKVNQYRKKWMLLMLFYKKSNIISNLIAERQQIIIAFDKAKNEYIQLVADKKKLHPNR